MIGIKVTNLRNVKMKVDRLPEKLVKAGRLTVRELGTRLAQKMRMRVRVWRGTLKESIKSTQLDANTIQVTSLFYGRFLETGHTLTGIFIPPKLKGWLREKGIYIPFKAGLLDKGYYAFRAYPFIKPSIEEIKQEIMPTAERHAKKGIREAGFKGG